MLKIVDERMQNFIMLGLFCQAFGRGVSVVYNDTLHSPINYIGSPGTSIKNKPSSTITSRILHSTYLRNTEESNKPGNWEEDGQNPVPLQEMGVF